MFDFSEYEEEELQKKVVHPGEYFHVTGRNLGEFIVLRPRYCKEEGNFISFAPSIKQCVEALPLWNLVVNNRLQSNGKEKFVYLYSHTRPYSVFS